MKKAERNVALLAAVPLILLGPTYTGILGSEAGERAIGGRRVDGSSGTPVAEAAVHVADTDLGSLTGSEGRFLIRGVDGTDAVEVVIRHPCFHTVRVEIADAGDTALEAGLPFRESNPKEQLLGRCLGYGPAH